MELTITVILVIITVIVSLGAFNNPKTMDDLIFYPPAVSRRGQWYRFFSCGLIHADAAHLIFNMLTLYLFGRFVEVEFMTNFGEKAKFIYLLMYVLALPISILPTYFRHKDNYHYRSLGASGAVSAVIFAGLLIAPYASVRFFFIPIDIPGFIFAPLYLIITIWMDRRGTDNVNHSAHLWGALFGLAFVVLLGRIYDEPIISRFIEYMQMWFADKGIGN